MRSISGGLRIVICVTMSLEFLWRNGIIIASVLL